MKKLMKNGICISEMSEIRERKKTNLTKGENGHVAVQKSNYWSLWLSEDASKRRGEEWFFKYTFVWIGMVMIIIGSRMFEHFDGKSYMAVGVIIGFPCVLYPLFFPGKEESFIPWYQRYTTKANLYVWILSFNANYFWTHYFYQVLGAKYTFPCWRLNNVPFNLYLITQSYFATYHLFSNFLLRRLWRAVSSFPSFISYAIVFLFLCVFSYFVAFTETFTIQHFPYYELADRYAMYVYGSVFYALYFMCSFPMFLRLDENPRDKWTLSRTFIDAMACSMMITAALDFWRISIGPLSQFYSIPINATAGSTESASSVPFVF